MRRRRYDAVVVLHRSAGAIRKLASMIGAPVVAGVSHGGDGYTHPARPAAGVESSREENRRVLESIGVTEDGRAVELWAPAADSTWAEKFLAGLPRPIIGLHPGSDWSCQQWLPDRFAEVGRDLQARTGGTVVITGSRGERETEAELARGLGPNVLRACGETTFGQFVEVVRRLDVLVCVNSAAAAVARATGTPAVVLLGLEDARYTGLERSPLLSVIQPEGPPHEGSWCEFGRWGVLSGCDSPMCRGLGGLSLVPTAGVTAAALDLLEAGGAGRGTGTG